MPLPILSNPSRVTQIGYCTNVHAGRDFANVLENLTQFCSPVREQVAPNGKLGVGLWFSEVSAIQALQPENLTLLQRKLIELNLVPFTFNGFPQGDFHSQVVKHRVYQPTWWQPERLAYTRHLIRLLDSLLPAGQIGSISTLPISWGQPSPTQDQLKLAAANLVAVAEELHQLFETSGRTIVLAIEPEPGCYLTDSASFRRFYKEYLCSKAGSSRVHSSVQSHLTLCHDICHAAVMFEDQAYELGQLKNDGIAIGKIQVSSAIRACWRDMDVEARAEAIEQLKSFAEDRYLHQTHIRGNANQASVLIEDLPAALKDVTFQSDFSDEWRIHFHVPIYLKEFGRLRSTQDEILNSVRILREPEMECLNFTGHWEVETYAWGVLPPALRQSSLSQGISMEINWLQSHFEETDPLKLG